jgi:hypothetical protein
MAEHFRYFHGGIHKGYAAQHDKQPDNQMLLHRLLPFRAKPMLAPSVALSNAPFESLTRPGLWLFNCLNIYAVSDFRHLRDPVESVLIRGCLGTSG